MSVDLDRIFEGMAQEADRAVLPPVESIHRRARRRTGIVAARLLSVLSIVAALTFTTYAAVGPRPEPGPDPTPGPTAALGEFLPFDGDAPPVIRFGASSGNALTITRDDVTYASWSEPSGPRLAAIDLKTSRALWGPLRVDGVTSITDMKVSHAAILIVVPDGGSLRFVTLDPANGRVMWKRDTPMEQRTSYLLYHDVVVLGLASTRKVESVDLRTGETVWSTDWTPKWHGLTAVRHFEDFLEVGGYDSLLVPGDRRFVMHAPGSRIEVRDVGTGEVLAVFPARTDGLTTTDLVVGGKLYLAGQGGVTMFDLQDPGPPTKIYDSDTSKVTPCGPVLICVIASSMIAIDPATRKPLWENPIYGLATPFPAHDAILAPNVDSYSVYDLAGKQLLSVRGLARWVDHQHVLGLGDDGMSAYDVTTGERMLLGKVPPGMLCSWNATMLACPTPEGIKVWRYRG